MKKTYISPISESVEIFSEGTLLSGSSFRTNAASNDVDDSRRSIQKQSMWNKE